MLPVLPPAALGQEALACGALGACIGAVRALFPVRGRAAIAPDALLVGGLLLTLQSYAAGQSLAGELRWYMAAAGFAGAFAAAAVLGIPLRCIGRRLAALLRLPGQLVRRAVLQPLAYRCAARRQARNARRNAKRTAKNPKKNLPNKRRMLYNSNVSK